MSTLLLEKLQKKPVPKDIEKPVAKKLGSEQVEVQIEIEDQSSTANFDISLLKERIKRKGLAAPRIEVKVNESDKIRDDERKGESDEPEKVDVPVSKPKKLKSTVKLSGKNDPENLNNLSPVLTVPPESIIYQDIPLGDI